MSITVIDSREDTRVPFLRGILTRSLQDAGLSFADAYEIANEARSTLGSDAEITTEALTGLVTDLLKKAGHADILERYPRSLQEPPRITVIDRTGQGSPFSKGRLSRSLEICAFPQDECYAITSAIELLLLTRNVTELTSTRLARVTYEYLLEHEPPDMAQRYLVWIEFSRSGQPLVLLVGGTTGCGKSTISAEIAHRLNIVRTQSTDMLREVMRLMVPERLLPALHASSYTAWQTLPSRNEAPVSFETHFVDGYLTQAREVGVGVEGVLQRARREQVSLIMEGVHIYPGLQQQLMRANEVLMVPVILAVLKRKQLRRHLQGRGQRTPSRRAERYLEHFDAIWELQSFLLEEADRHHIPILPNVELQETTRLVMETISAHLARHFSGDPDAVFAA